MKYSELACKCIEDYEQGNNRCTTDDMNKCRRVLLGMLQAHKKKLRSTVSISNDSIEIYVKKSTIFNMTKISIGSEVYGVYKYTLLTGKCQELFMGRLVK